MGYETKYHPHLCKKLPLKRDRNKVSHMIIWVVLACILFAGVNLRSRAFWRDFLIPGDTDQTIAAIETFAENVKSGESIESAFHAFCLEIVKDA